MNTAAVDPVERLLARLEDVRKTGRGWIAKCPAHTDRSASLSIAAGDDGRVLLHDFAGCETSDILVALGLDVTDLFPKRLKHTTTPAERAEVRERALQADWRAALSVLEFETKIVLIAAHDMRTAVTLDRADIARLAVAVERIEGARANLCPVQKYRPVIS